MTRHIIRTALCILFLSICLSSQAQSWGDIDYDGQPWVENVSRPYEISRGLQNRHIAVWASHGSYYDQTRGEWRWQRPTLFCTNEDLFTQTIVVPYLIPMLENAGAEAVRYHIPEVGTEHLLIALLKDWMSDL